MKGYKAKLKHVCPPDKDCSLKPINLSDETIEERRNKILNGMKQAGLETLVVYGDAEHGGNFEYLVGYFTRFEEALLVIQSDGRMSLVLGNENLNKAPKARIEANAVHMPMFSLPNQPYEINKSLSGQLCAAGLAAGKATGIVGWKLFTSPYEDNSYLFDVPSFIVDRIKDIVGADNVVNAAAIFIGADGARITNNANEIAHYEFAAALASDCMLDAMDELDVGVTEMAVGDKLNRYGQKTSVVTIAASGPRFVKGNMFPTDNEVKLGDTISLTVGYRGGLSSRAGYAVSGMSELPEGKKDYVDCVAGPYFNCYAAWLAGIHIGMTGGKLYELVQEELPQEEYHWGLCPGHLTAEEEWLCSPIYRGSKEELRSGMMLQIDIIPFVPGYGGVSAESAIALADEKLREEIRLQYPDMWQRMQVRRKYLTETLGIPLNEEVLPLCSTVGYMRPYLLSKDQAMVWEKTEAL